jgi:hypothetical protein
VNPKIRAINGYTSIFQGNNSLDFLLKLWLKCQWSLL